MSVLETEGRQKETVSLREAATRLGRNEAELGARMRYCALNGLVFPLGFAMPPAREDGQWAYIIPRRRFERYMTGEDLVLAGRWQEE